MFRPFAERAVERNPNAEIALRAARLQRLAGFVGDFRDIQGIVELKDGGIGTLRKQREIHGDMRRNRLRIGLDLGVDVVMLNENARAPLLCE